MTGKKGLHDIFRLKLTLYFHFDKLIIQPVGVLLEVYDVQQLFFICGAIFDFLNYSRVLFQLFKSICDFIVYVFGHFYGFNE